jgi:hypothetical protein
VGLPHGWPVAFPRFAWFTFRVQTTLDIPDSLFEQVQAYAAQRGESLEQVVRNTLAQKFGVPAARSAKQSWLDELPKLSPEAMEEARELDKWFNSPEFRPIDPEHWQ